MTTIWCASSRSRWTCLAGAHRELPWAHHVLHGALSPLEGIFAEDLKIAELEKRVREGEIREIILATNPTSEGDYTAATSSSA